MPSKWSTGKPETFQNEATMAQIPRINLCEIRGIRGLFFDGPWTSDYNALAINPWLADLLAKKENSYVS
jgi:hypothetical protein